MNDHDPSHRCQPTSICSHLTPMLYDGPKNRVTMVAGITWAQQEWVSLSTKMVEILSLLHIRFANNRDQNLAFVMVQFLEEIRSQVGYIGLLPWKVQMLIFINFCIYSEFGFIFPAWVISACTTTQRLTKYLTYWYVIPHDIALDQRAYFLRK